MAQSVFPAVLPTISSGNWLELQKIIFVLVCIFSHESPLNPFPSFLLCLDVLFIIKAKFPLKLLSFTHFSVIRLWNKSDNRFWLTLAAIKEFQDCCSQKSWSEQTSVHISLKRQLICHFSCTYMYNDLSERKFGTRFTASWTTLHM